MLNGQTLEQRVVTKFAQELLTFLKQRPGVSLESLSHSTPEMSFDLGKARKNQLIHNRAGDRIFVTNLTGVAYIRFNSTTASKYRLRIGSISTPFQKLYLVNEAQAGKSVSIIIGYGAFVDFASAYLTTKLLKPDDTEVSPASEEKQDSMIGQLDIKMTQLRDALMNSAAPKDLKDLYDKLSSMQGQLDNKTSTLAREEGGNLLAVKNSAAKLDIFISELRDAIIGVVGPKTLLDVVNALEELAAKIEIQGTAFNQQTAVNVGTSATLILAENANRKGFYIRHNGDDIIYLGNGTVATGNGLPFFPGNIFTEEHLPVTAAIYGIVASGTQPVRIVEET